MSRPKIFIGSSTEGLDVANAIQQNLDIHAEVTIWTQGVFQLSATIINSLINSLNKFDFAIFVFSPDDVTQMRGKQNSTVRDNVIYETGLFSGKLGVDKVFFIKPRNHEDLHLPTDMLGMIAGEYDADRSDKNLVAATGPFCNQVRQIVQKVDFATDSPSSQPSLLLDFENDIKILQSYMEEKEWTSMSFENIKAHVHPRFTEDHLMKLVDNFPKAVRRCKLKDGIFGIKLL